MTLRDLIDFAEDYPEAKDMKLFVGWDEIANVMIRADRVYPYLEVVTEELPDLATDENYGD